MSEWHAADKVADYRSRAADIPHRQEGEAVLVEVLPGWVGRVLDVETPAALAAAARLRGRRVLWKWRELALLYGVRPG
jgi:hypothetical protein